MDVWYENAKSTPRNIFILVFREKYWKTYLEVKDYLVSKKIPLKKSSELHLPISEACEHVTAKQKCTFSPGASQALGPVPPSAPCCCQSTGAADSQQRWSYLMTPGNWGSRQTGNLPGVFLNAVHCWGSCGALSRRCALKLVTVALLHPINWWVGLHVGICCSQSITVSSMCKGTSSFAHFQHVLCLFAAMLPVMLGTLQFVAWAVVPWAVLGPPLIPRNDEQVGGHSWRRAWASWSCSQHRESTSLSGCLAQVDTSYPCSTLWLVLCSEGPWCCDMLVILEPLGTMTPPGLGMGELLGSVHLSAQQGPHSCLVLRGSPLGLEICHEWQTQSHI